MSATVVPMTMRAVPDGNGGMRHVPTPLALVPAAKGRGKKRTPPDPIVTNGEGAAERLRLIIERLERLDEEAQGIADDKKDVLSEAKSAGYDGKGIRAILALRKLEKHTRDEFEAIVDTYRDALGLA